VLEVFRARVKPELLGPIVSSFEDGSVVHTGEDVPRPSTRSSSTRSTGCRAVLADLGVGESPAGLASGIEFVLEGCTSRSASTRTRSAAGPRTAPAADVERSGEHYAGVPGCG
jgi:hypothetical protein